MCDLIGARLPLLRRYPEAGRTAAYIKRAKKKRRGIAPDATFQIDLYLRLLRRHILPAAAGR